MYRLALPIAFVLFTTSYSVQLTFGSQCSPGSYRLKKPLLTTHQQHRDKVLNGDTLELLQQNTTTRPPLAPLGWNNNKTLSS